jgi:hypothetical protein
MKKSDPKVEIIPEEGEKLVIVHSCNQEEKLGRILGIMENIIKEFYGNGQKGIAREFPELRGAVENLTTMVVAQTNVITNLITAQATATGKEDGIKSEKDNNYKNKLSTMQRTSIIISAIIGASIILVTIILKFV